MQQKDLTPQEKAALARKEKEERVAAALRANLQKRKQQQIKRTDTVSPSIDKVKG